MFIYNPLWQSSGIIIVLCKYDIVISDTLVCFFLNVLLSFSSPLSLQPCTVSMVFVSLVKKYNSSVLTRCCVVLSQLVINATFCSNCRSVLTRCCVVLSEFVIKSSQFVITVAFCNIAICNKPDLFCNNFLLHFVMISVAFCNVS